MLVTTALFRGDEYAFADVCARIDALDSIESEFLFYGRGDLTSAFINTFLSANRRHRTMPKECVPEIIKFYIISGALEIRKSKAIEENLDKVVTIMENTGWETHFLATNTGTLVMSELLGLRPEHSCVCVHGDVSLTLDFAPDVREAMKQYIRSSHDENGVSSATDY